MANSKGKKEKGQNLLFQFNVFCVLFILAIISVTAVTALQQISVVTAMFCARIGLPVTDQVAAFIDGDKFEELSRTLDANDPYYEEVRRKMLALKESVDCLYLYTMAPVSEQIFNFIIDGSSPTDDVDFSHLGTPDDVSDYGAVFMRTLTTKTSQFGTLENDDVWGWLISTYTPILNSRGEAVGIIGCDFEAGAVFQELWLQILRQAILPVIIIFAGLGLYFPMIRGINKLTGDLKSERDEITAMKDNLKVGLFLMNRDYIIQPQYSKALEKVLGDASLQGKNFIDLLSNSLSEKERESLKKYFKMFQKKSFKQDMLDELNPLTEFKYIHP
ncbi:MAG: hypothetical protein LBP93_07325, partial [Treponema sp.]|nr:hypothetical protein [Treponema sp.]